MKLPQFERLAQTYGGKIARWPTSVQRGAQAFLTAHEAARPVLEREEQLDAQLAAFGVPEPSADLQRRVTTRLIAERRPLRSLTGWMAALTAALSAGAVAAGALAGAAWIDLSPSLRDAAPPGSTRASIYDQSSFGDLGVGDQGFQGKPGAA